MFTVSRLTASIDLLMRSVSKNIKEFMIIFIGLFALLAMYLIFQTLIASSPLLSAIFIEPTCDATSYCTQH